MNDWEINEAHVTTTLEFTANKKDSEKPKQENPLESHVKPAVPPSPTAPAEDLDDSLSQESDDSFASALSKAPIVKKKTINDKNKLKDDPLKDIEALTTKKDIGEDLDLDSNSMSSDDDSGDEDLTSVKKPLDLDSKKPKNSLLDNLSPPTSILDKSPLDKTTGSADSIAKKIIDNVKKTEGVKSSDVKVDHNGPVTSISVSKNISHPD